MGKRKRSDNQNSAKAKNLVKNPVNVGEHEFEKFDTFEELKSYKYMGRTKNNKIAFQDWSTDGLKNKQKNVKVFEDEKELILPEKLTLSGKKAINGDKQKGQVGESVIPLKKKKKGEQTQQKASYDKTSEAIEAISAANKNKNNIMAPEYMQAKLKKNPVDVTAWNKLQTPECIKKALSEIGFSVPTDIQEKSIGSAITERCDILGAAETGSGKTLAFGIPIIAGILKDRQKIKGNIQKNKNVDVLRQKTQLRKDNMAQAMREDDSDFSESEEDSDDNSSYVETDDEDVEEYIYNGADGIAEISYDDMKNKKTESKKGKNQKNDNESDDESMNSEEDIESDFAEEENGLNSDLDGEENGLNSADDSDLDEEENGLNSADNSDLDEEENGLNSDLDGEENGLNSADDSDLDEENGLNSADNSDLDEEERMIEGLEIDETMDSGEDEQITSDEDLGTDDEEDLENDIEDENKIGLVRVLNDVQFNFGKLMKKRNVKLEETEEKSLLRALILTPTRELAVQINSHLSQVCKYSDIKLGVVVGGLDARKQKRILKRTCPEIVVATPGRLWELIKEGVHHLKELGGVRYLAIDEADRMIDTKNFEEVGKIIKLLNGGTEKNTSGTDRQTFIFSATLTMIHALPQRLQTKHNKTVKSTSEDKLRKLAKLVGCKPSAKIFDITRKTATAENLTESRINCEQHEKDYYLYYFLHRHPGRTMVFCNSIEAVKRLKGVFTTLNFNPQDLHASMHQKQRLRHLQQFSSLPNSLLITTDVAARGLDIKGVQHVIHFQVPFTAESYVHRSGRTARANRNGLSIIFIEPKDVLKFRQICYTIGRNDINDIPFFPVEESIYDQVTDRVDLAVKLEKLEYHTRREDWEKEEKAKAAKEIGLEESEDEIDQEDYSLMSARDRKMRLPGAKKKEVQYMRKQLEMLLVKPIAGSMFSFSHPRSKASIAAVIGAPKESLADSLVGLNSKNVLFQDPEQTYKERYAQELFGDMPLEPGLAKSDSFKSYKQQRKEMAKITKKLLKPEKSIRDDMKKMREKMILKKQAKATKKREKRKKRKTK